MTTAVVGLVLAAGAGRRYGGPKALVMDDDGVAWVQRAARRLHDGGCRRVHVVVGAEADEVRARVDPQDLVTEADDWEEGMGASLRAGLNGLVAHEPSAVAAVVMLVDLPDVGPDVVRRLVERARTDVLARASYDGEGGHPVLLGRDHWEAIISSARGDRGARDYLAEHKTTLVESADIGSPRDVDYR
jgi:CTP:molybdopterin cytidylyltransferase MocA